MKFINTILLMLIATFVALGQPAEQMWHVAVYPTDGQWNRIEGDKVKFNVTLTRCDVPTGDMEVRYSISQDMMKPRKEGRLQLKNGMGMIEAGTLNEPGFLRCIVSLKINGKDYEGRGTVGFSPEKLQLVTSLPADFDEFWAGALKDARKWGLEPMMTLVPERCTPKVNVYNVSWGNDGWASRMYGVLTVPVGDGPWPAILKLPGAGVRAYKGDIGHTEKGVMILEVGIHGIPIDLPDEVYTRLYNGPLKGYHSFNFNDRDRFYYKRVITGCIRAIDFIGQLPFFNGCLATFGGSQGGGLSIIVAGLDPRVDALVSYYPAMSDMAGYTAGRAGGWPHTLRDKKFHTPGIVNTLSYYDVSSFARKVSVPGFYTFGYNDMVCPPTTTWSVYNVVDAPKQLMVTETTAHYGYNEQAREAWKWVIDFLKQCK